MVSSEARGTGASLEHQVVMYSLSTCVWCRKMREFLESERLVFEVVYVDKLEGSEQDAALAEVRRWNPTG